MTMDLLLECQPPGGEPPRDVHFYIAQSALGSQLDDLPGTSGLEISFFRPSPDIVNPGAVIAQGTIRDQDGQLILLGHMTLLDGTLLEGDAVEVGRPLWLEPGSKPHTLWNAPFGDMTARHTGCEPRESLRPGSRFETPLVLEFRADDGAVTLYDRDSAQALEVDGQTFDVIVTDAFFRNDLNCGDCPVTEIIFLVLRTAS